MLSPSSAARSLILTISALLPCQSALATDVVVGSGSPGSCTDAALASAVATVSGAGGKITFNCGGAATITLASPRVFQNAGNPNLVYTLDGGGLITLNGAGATRLIYHSTGTLNVQNITLTGGVTQGAADNASGGALFSDGGLIGGAAPLHLNVTNVTFTGNATNLTSWMSPPFSPYDYGGGALFTRWGVVTVTACKFNGNSAFNSAGGAMHARSSAVTIRGSDFTGNTSTGGGFGGALYIDGLSPPPSSVNGTLNVSATRFTGNHTRNEGGAVFFYLCYPKNESVTFDTVNVSDNHVDDASGGPQGIQAYGGGIGAICGNVTLLNSTIASNVARSLAAGGGGTGGGIVLSGNNAIVIRNSTITGNRGEGSSNLAAGGGLAIFNNTQAFEITHSTIVNNYAGYVGGGIFTANAPGTLRNTIVANNVADAFPGFGDQCGATLTNGGGVLEFPTNNPTCASGATLADPLLGALANNGGFAPTHLPQFGSPAIDTAACVLLSDQRAVSRPQGPACDKGAVEVTATAPAGPATNYFTVPPCRVVDTRQPGGPTGGAPIVCGLNPAFTVAGACGVPIGARAVTANVAVTQPTGPQALAIFPAGSQPPLASVLNYSAGQTRGNNAILALSAGGQITPYCGPSGTAHVIIDVSGYFQ